MGRGSETQLQVVEKLNVFLGTVLRFKTEKNLISFQTSRFANICANINIFQPPEVVGRGSETQLKVVE